ncbi:MAG: (E)-4-hydroxy-3-methylbut-2-enyl-diphosphate synthase [Paludibacteraceae bacterium]|nr:(E)-4-hydroxy-3-methylbut-2-enyl-diphosphate synthase [Paludibacteraceae bacterium]
MGQFDYKRRVTREVRVGNIAIGGENGICVQTMGNVDTNDIEATVAQAKRCAETGAELVRFTTQGVKEVESLKEARKILREEGCNVPLVADIHFNANVAFEAAGAVEKIRINPGNFVAGKAGDYTDDEWADEVEKVKEKLRPIVERCKESNTAIRIGVNHGSMSKRMMSRWGDTPRGLAESCIEFIEMMEGMEFREIVVSVKASNVRVMVQTVRLLAKMMDEREMNYPIHLGVTEAGSDDEGRVKSAIGIGTLLMEGIGDTIRVSLSEKPEAEIPVAQKLVKYINHRSTDVKVPFEGELTYDPFEYHRRESEKADKIGGGQVPVVISYSEGVGADYTVFTAPKFLMVGGVKDIDDMMVEALRLNPDVPLMLAPANPNFAGEMKAMISKFNSEGLRNPVIGSRVYMTDDMEELQVMAGVDFGGLLIDGQLDGLYIFCRSEKITEAQVVEMEMMMLQASRARITQTEYISCPSCGRTKFDLPEVVRKVKAATKQFKGLKIAVMGCIVNGPGEMADADFGYIGGAKGKVSLFKGKECVVKNIDEAEAVDKLCELIKLTIEN